MIDHEKLAQLEKQIRAEMKRLHIPGAAIGIIHAGQEFSTGFGVTNVENPQPVNSDTLFQIGSITKTVTATALMRLVERGQADLDTPLRRYLPELHLADHDAFERATLRHVLSHTCGWVGDYFDDAGAGDDALKTVVSRMDHLEQETPLGAIWSYNNAGFYLAGRVIEVLTGKTYETAVQELVLDPLGMSRSFFFAQDAITYRVAAGHQAVYPGEKRRPEVLRPWGLVRASNPLGGLLSTIHDLFRYAQFHLGDGQTPGGERLLDSQTLVAMRTPGAPAANGEWMGIAWFMRESEGVWIVSHSGATNGQMATFQLVPQYKFAFIMLTNSDRGDELYRPLQRKVLELYLGISESDPQPIPVGPSDLAQYAGKYSASAQDLILSIQNGALILRVEPKGGFPTSDAPPLPPPPPTRLAFCGVDILLAIDEPFKGDRGEFLRDNQGNLIWLRFAGRIHRRN